MLMITSSPAPDSASSVTSVWRLSWSAKERYECIKRPPSTLPLCAPPRRAAFGSGDRQVIRPDHERDLPTW
jgi:hypothetical protein